MMAPRETAGIAARLIATSCARHEIPPGQLTIHAARGSSMTSKPVAQLLADLGVTKMHSRPGASWLNMVEAWLGILTRQSMRRGPFHSVRALAQHIDIYLAHWNDDPTHFVWAKAPADIIRKAVRH